MVSILVGMATALILAAQQPNVPDSLRIQALQVAGAALQYAQQHPDVAVVQPLYSRADYIKADIASLDTYISRLEGEIAIRFEQDRRVYGANYEAQFGSYRDEKLAEIAKAKSQREVLLAELKGL